MDILRRAAPCRNPPVTFTLDRMKHASLLTLRQLEPLLARIRAIDGLIERKPGIFYRRSSAFLHFHEDAAGLFADVKLNGLDFERLPVSTKEEREALLVAVSGCASTNVLASPRRQSQGRRRAA